MLRPALLAALALGVGAAQAADHRAGALEASGLWSRPAVAGFNGVGYMRLANHGRRAEALIKVESPLARAVEIHRSTMTDGVMSMSAAARVEVPARGQVAFAPGAYHLMFLHLAKSLKPGDRLPATLVFAHGQRLAVSFAVSEGAPPVVHSAAGG